MNSSPTCADMSGRSAGGGGPLVHFGNGGPPNHRSLPPCGGAGRSPLVQTNSLGRSLPQPPPPPPPPAPGGGGHHQLNLKLGGALGGLTGLFTRLDRALQGEFHLCITRKGIARPKSQFPHLCVCERIIYSKDRSTYFPAAK